ncbi:hypothetical protein ACIQBJ_08585 [Kitasatospora sp. NPDC088391]|uniref:hypothetical protein n=1 Tax=Kitasatospora sp. NPDC088391 TaxID=3364074 RepID=UPI00380CFE3E
MARGVIRGAASGAVPLLFSVLLAALFTGASAGVSAAAQGNGTVVIGVSGVPARVAPGEGFTVAFTLDSTSRYRVLVRSLVLELADATGPAAGPDDLAVQWRDDATSTWRESDHYGPESWGTTPAVPLTIAPHGSLTVRARVVLGSAAPAGTYLLAMDGPAAYTVVDGAGRDVGPLDGHNRAQAVFRCAVPGPSASPAPTPSGSATAGPDPSASAPVTAGPSAPTAAPSAVAPPPTVGAALALLPAEDTGPTGPGSVPGPSASAPERSPAAAAQRLPEAAAASVAGRGSTLRLVFGVAAIVLGCSMGTALLVRRHSHAHHPDR